MTQLISPKNVHELTNKNVDKYLQLKTIVINTLNVAISAYASQGLHMAIISTSDLLTSLNKYLNETSQNKSFHFELNNVLLSRLITNVISDTNNRGEGYYMLDGINDNYVTIYWN